MFLQDNLIRPQYWNSPNVLTIRVWKLSFNTSTCVVVSKGKCTFIVNKLSLKCLSFDCTSSGDFSFCHYWIPDVYKWSLAFLGVIFLNRQIQFKVELSPAFGFRVCIPLQFTQVIYVGISVRSLYIPHTIYKQPDTNGLPKM